MVGVDKPLGVVDIYFSNDKCCKCVGREFVEFKWKGVEVGVGCVGGSIPQCKSDPTCIGMYFEPESLSTRGVIVMCDG